jgi:phage tail-like protein
VTDLHHQYQGGYFSLEVDGLDIGYFSSLSGLQQTTEPVDNWETTAEGRPVNRKYPGKTTYGDVNLSRGLTASTAIQDWHKDIIQGNYVRKNGSIVMYDSTGAEVARWNFENGFPTSTTVGDLDANSEDIVVESLTMTVEFAERVK